MPPRRSLRTGLATGVLILSFAASGASVAPGESVAPGAADAVHCPEDLVESLVRAAAVADSTSLARWAEACPDRVYLATVRIADRALGEESDFHAARWIAEVYGRHGGHPPLAAHVDVLASYDTEQIARHALADSLQSEGMRLYGLAQYSEALSLLEQALTRYEQLGDERAAGLSHAQMAGVLNLAGETEEARRHARDSIRIARQLGFAAGLASGLFALGGIELQQGDLRVVIDAFRETQRIGEALHADNYVAASLAMLANVYYLAGRYDESLAMHEDGLALFRELGAPRNVVGELINIAYIHSTDLAHYEDAVRALEEAIAICSEQGYTSLEALALGSLADVQAARGNPEVALATASRAVSSLRSGVDRESLSNALTKRGRILREMGRSEEARVEIRRALSLAREGVSTYSLCETLAQLAITEVEGGDAPRGLVLAREAIERFEAARGQIGAEGLRATSIHLKPHLYEAALLSLADLDRESPGEGHAAEAFRLVEQCKSGTMLDFLAARRGIAARPSDPVRDTLTDELSSLQLNLLRTTGDGEEREWICREIRHVRARLDSLEMATFGSTRGASGTAVRSPADVVEAVGSSGDLLLEFFWGREMVYGWALGCDEIRFFPVGPADDLEGLVQIFGSLVRDPSRRPEESPAPGQLSRTLLDPVADLLSESERLIVVPDGPLLTIPFEALPYLAGSSSGPGFLVEVFDVSYNPSASLWGHLTSLAGTRARAPRELLAFGDPVLGTEDPRWPRLAWASVELAELERILSPRASGFLQGAAASEDRARSSAVSDYRALHFATHAYAATADPSVSGLLLAPSEENDGFLTPFEILDLGLRAEIVTLSACETGRGRLVTGEGILGLSRAFFHGGSLSVLASLWEVDDRQTARLMSRFYEHLAAGASKGSALSCTKREALTGADGFSSHPYYWASFVLLGDADGTPTLTPRAWYERWAVWPVAGLVLAGALAVGRRRRG